MCGWCVIRRTVRAARKGSFMPPSKLKTRFQSYLDAASARTLVVLDADRWMDADRWKYQCDVKNTRTQYKNSTQQYPHLSPFHISPTKKKCCRCSIVFPAGWLRVRRSLRPRSLGQQQRRGRPRKNFPRNGRGRPTTRSGRNWPS